MKKGIIAVLIISLTFISGCSSKTGFNREKFMNLTEEERQKMMQERQQIAMDACMEKVEGDECLIKSSMGEMKGKCIIMDKDLVCTNPDMPKRRNE